MSYRVASLVAFVVAHSALTIGLRFHAEHTLAHETQDESISSTIVVLTEFAKLFLSIVVCFIVDAKGNLFVFGTLLQKAFVEEGADLLKLSVPATLYTIQNNLQYVIETAPLFLVMYQLKIVTTAVFFSTMLNRRIHTREWLCILALAIGVGLVQSSQTDVHIHHASNVAGVLSVFFAILSSGFAGVYFEKVLKSSKSSIWMINIQLSLISAALSMSECLIEDTEAIAKKGFFKGYNSYVLMVIVLQAMAGLVVALVVKYADNIHKGFATSVACVFSSVLDYFLFDDTTLNEAFATGSFLVLLSSVLFAINTSHAHAAHSHATLFHAHGSNYSSLPQTEKSSASSSSSSSSSSSLSSSSSSIIAKLVSESPSKTKPMQQVEEASSSSSTTTAAGTAAAAAVAKLELGAGGGDEDEKAKGGRDGFFSLLVKRAAAAAFSR